MLAPYPLFATSINVSVNNLLPSIKLFTDMVASTHMISCIKEV